MSLNISNINNTSNTNRVTFGMAKFSEKGYQLAGLHSDIYESLAQPNDFPNPEFFKPKNFFRKAPFTKYYIERSNTNDMKAIDEVANTIIKCGTSDNSHTNMCFIGQLLSTEKYIHSSNDETKSVIGKAVNEVFKKNWDNPELSKKDTFRLLELAKYGMDDRAYVSLNGVLTTSDLK